MFAALRTRLLKLVLATLAVAGSAGVASANWITIKNDSGKTITIQETVVVDGKAKRCKTTQLLPGETLREFVPGPTTKHVEVFDAKSPNQGAWLGSLHCKDETQTFSVTAGGGKFTVGQLVTPAKK